jgi:CubicO group peptidase (beta-lactamase class C family)
MTGAVISFILMLTLSIGTADAGGGAAPMAELLEPIREKHKLPAMCAAAVSSEELTASGAVGVRRAGSGTAATSDDLWHLGSNTKAMTAALIGRLAEEGLVRWDSTMAEVFVELAARMRPEMKNVTVLDLLSHEAGLTENLAWGEYSQKGTVQEQRYEALKAALMEKPKYAAGTGAHYSNLGYVAAGAVVERVTGEAWEEQIRKHIFEPLGMTTAGFGGVGTEGMLDQPWGHDSEGKAAATNGPGADNPPVMAPAGGVHCSMADWAKFVRDQLRGAMDKPGLLKAETYHVLQRPASGGEYGLGWLVLERAWGDGTVFHHAGSNTMNYANVWIAPKRDFAVLVCTNQGGDAAFGATDEAVSAILGAYLPPSK